LWWNHWIILPSFSFAVTECGHLPNNREEIPTPDVAQNYSHLHDITQHIPPLDDNDKIMLLIGRDAIQAHYVLNQRFGPPGAPYAQELPSGWTIMGEACLGGTQLPENINSMKTDVLDTGQGMMLYKFPNQFSSTDKQSILKSFNDSVCDIVADRMLQNPDEDKEVRPELVITISRKPINQTNHVIS
jgi:hypothetical protein